jgi:DNA-binding NtrC family response regulator
MHTDNSAMTERKSADLPAGKGARVLVVEDGWQVADSLKLLLEQIGMIAVGPAATSEDARRLATQCNLELAIVDVNLKGEMAYELMEWLHDRGTPVIVISGYHDLPPQLQRYSAILRKPFTPDALLTTVRRTIAGNRRP